MAGSGKTMILSYRAEYLARAAANHKPILVLCYNQPLAVKLDALMAAKDGGGRPGVLAPVRAVPQADYTAFVGQARPTTLDDVVAGTGDVHGSFYLSGDALARWQFL